MTHAQIIARAATIIGCDHLLPEYGVWDEARFGCCCLDWLAEQISVELSTAHNGAWSVHELEWASDGDGCCGRMICSHKLRHVALAKAAISVWKQLDRKARSGKITGRGRCKRPVPKHGQLQGASHV